MKHLFIWGAVFWGLTLNAELLKNTDQNTLWIENGKNIKTDAQNGFSNGWYSKPSDPRCVKIESMPDGKGFSCSVQSGKLGQTYLAVPTSPDYPYLTFQILAIEYFPGYRGWICQISKTGFSVDQISTPKPGIFAFNVYENAPAINNKSQNYIRIYNYGMKTVFSEIKMVKKPDYYIAAQSNAFKNKQSFTVGDKIKFTVYLKEAAEDVSIRLSTTGVPNIIKINKTNKIQLKPTDESQKIWETEVEIKDLRGAKSKRNAILMQAVVLGGELDVPIWSAIAYPFIAPGAKK